ncbi:hypothetical protein BB558_007268, partial [Smittium angustum]
ENSNQKLNILALVAGTHTRAELLGLGFKMSKTNHSQSNGSYLVKPVYYLETTKIDVYISIINENPNTRLGLSNFYTLCPKNFKKGKKRVNMCPVCAKGEANTKKIKRMGPSHDTKASDAYKEYLDSLDGDTCAIVMDFKENFRVGGGPVEIGSAFYSKSQISDLGFATVYKDPEGDIKYKYFNFLSKVLSHDAKYVSKCLSDLLNNEFFSRFNRIHLWSDSGPQFRLQELLYSVFVDLTSQTDIVFKLNYFCEYHGKSIVDGHFGCLSRWFSQAAAPSRLVYKNSVDVVFRIYLQVIPRDIKCRYLVDGFKAYISYGMRNDQLVGCPLSTLNPLEYIDLNVKINEKKDIRQTKYSIPQNEVSADDVDPVMGSQSVSTQNSRLTLIDHIFGADSMNVDDCLL